MRPERIDPTNDRGSQSSDGSKLSLSDVLKQVQQQNKQFNIANKVQAAIETTDAHKRGLDLVIKSASALTNTETSRSLFNKKVDNKLLEDFNKIFTAEEESNTDKTGLSQAFSQMVKTKKLQQRNTAVNDGRGRELIPLDAESQDLLQKFVQIYGTALAHDSPLAKKEIERLEKELIARGVKASTLEDIKSNLRMSIRAEVMIQIKDAFTKRIMSTDTMVEMALNTKGLNDILDSAWNSKQLGGQDFGGYNINLQGTMNRVMGEVEREMQPFLTEILKQGMSAKLVGNNPTQTESELRKILNVAKRFDFDLNGFLAQWKKDKFQEGLFIMTIPQKETLLSTGTQSGSHKQKDHDLAEGETREEFLMNRLRAMYMRYALKGDFLSRMGIQMGIRKVKNGMIKLRIYSDELNETIKKEAENIARLKTMEMLKEALHERATLFTLSGSAYKMNEIKMLGLLKNAKRLNLEISEEDFMALRDKCNFEIFEVAKRELKLTEVAYKVTGLSHVLQKRSKLIQLLTRLKEESNIKLDIDEEQLSDTVSAK